MNIHLKSAVGRRCYGFNLYRPLENKSFEIPAGQELVVESSSAEKSLFDMMFSVNPLTKLPQGDIAQYLSDKTHPDVKNFIELQLLSPNNIKSDAGAEFSALSDDDIAEFTRGVNESVASYRSRMFETLKKDVLSSQNQRFINESSE